jgi:hypothetical protein
LSPQSERTRLRLDAGDGDADAFADISGVTENCIDCPYVDGVSITTAAPREHVFTFAGGHPLANQGIAECPCTGGAATQSFVGDDYFCEEPGLDCRPGGGRAFGPSDPLWDGADFQCVPGDPNKRDGAFFVRLGFFLTPQRRDLEVRIMHDQASSDEDIALVELELFVR